MTGSDTGINPGGITLDLADGGRVINNWGTGTHFRKSFHSISFSFSHSPLLEVKVNLGRDIIVYTAK